MCKFEELIDVAQKNKMTALAITDHGNMHGVVEFYDTLYKSGIKPIIGMEIYMVNSIKNDTREKNHLVLLVKNEIGYKNLIKIASFASTVGSYYKPTVDKECLLQYSNGLIAISACIQGEIPKKIIENDYEGAKESAIEYLKIFGDTNFYLELQNHGLDEEIIMNRGLKKLSSELSIPLVVTNDVHYIKKDDAKVHDILLCIQTGQTLKNQDRLRFRTKEFYFKNFEEMKIAFPDDESALHMSFEIANKCNFELKFQNKTFMPDYKIEGKETTTDEYNNYFEKIARNELPKKFKTITKDVMDRFEFELETIKKLGFAGYFLIVRDIINFAKQNNIAVGPGRGSAAGSIISYILGITNINPIKHNLLFERFLNPERITPPDIDVDFSDEERPKVIEFIVNKFGKEKVAQIVSFQTLKAKQAIRDVARVLDVSLKDVDLINKKIPDITTTFKDLLNDESFVAFINQNPVYKELINYAVRIEGCLRQDSIHPSGIVITPTNLTDYVPISIPKDTEKSDLNYMTQYNMATLEKLGLLKFDILGLRNLSVIKHTIEMVKENQGKEIVLDNENFDDEEVYKLLSRGETTGIFQLESEGMRDILKKIQPNKFDELIAIIALFRPGPMKMIDEYIKRKKGLTPIIYDFPELKHVETLKETYGITIYQEQVMEIAVKIAGFTFAQADILRRAMGKKKESEMLKMKKNFIDGSKKNGINEKRAEELFEKLEQFASYGFNKSHAAAYAILAYQTAYLKTHYTGEYTASLLTSVMDNIDKLGSYFREFLKNKSFKIITPDINKCDVTFRFVKNMLIYGLAAIKNVGFLAAEEIVSKRKEHGEYKDLFDFCSKVNLRIVNSKTIESLIKAGAFDFTFINRGQLLMMLDNAIKTGEKNQKDMQMGQFSLFGNEIKPVLETDKMYELSENEILSAEYEVLGTYVSTHPLIKYEKLLKYFTTKITEIKENRMDLKEQIYVGGIIKKIRKNSSKKNLSENSSINFYLEDLSGTIQVFVNEKIVKEKNDFFEENKLILLRGKFGFFNDKPVIYLESLIKLEDAYNVLGKFLHIKIFDSIVEEIVISEINNVISKHIGGKTNIIMHIITKNNKEIVVKFKDNEKIFINEELIQQLEMIVGEENVWLSWKET
jgi:DNA polymerase-3 subunit alpha